MSAKAKRRLFRLSTQAALVVGPATGQALVCTPRDCQVFESRTGAWATTAGPRVADPNRAYARLRNGDVVLVTGVVVQRRSADSGVWTEGARVPAELNHPQIEQLVDGRILLSDVDLAGKRLQTLVADEELTRWVSTGEVPTTGDTRWSLFSASLATTTEKTGKRAIWRYHADQWRKVPVSDWSNASDHRVLALDTRTLLLAREGQGCRARVVELTGVTLDSAFIPVASDWSPVAVMPAPGAPVHYTSVLLTDPHDNRSVLWRLGAAPVELPVDPMGIPDALVALDPEHYIGIGPSGTVQSLSLDDRDSTRKPCDGLTAFLQKSFGDQVPFEHRRPDGRAAAGHSYPSWEEDMEKVLRSPFPIGPLGYARLVTPACREQVSHGDAPLLSELVRSCARGAGAAQDARPSVAGSEGSTCSRVRSIAQGSLCV